MTTRDASIDQSDLRDAVEALEGMEVVLRRLHEERRGEEDGDQLLDDLRELPGATGVLEALRYQDGVGMGWFYVAENVAKLRRSLATHLRSS